MLSNELRGIQIVCVIVLIVYVCMFVGGVWILPQMFFSSAVKQAFIKVFGDGVYSASRILWPLALVIQFFLIVGATQTLKLSSKGRKTLLIASFASILLNFAYAICYLLVGTEYLKFMAFLSFWSLPRFDFILSIFTIYFFTRRSVKEQFAK